MRLHMIIQRHGLPVTRILWTTSSPSLPGSGSSSSGLLSSVLTASSSGLTSTRTPSAAFGVGGYTIACLLEDVNEVVPLETEEGFPGPDGETSGQWGLEDYVVEVGGSECLHFMEVEGLLKDGDEVVYANSLTLFPLFSFLPPFPPLFVLLSRSTIDILSCRIRALQTVDLRARRLSGRHQISSDGKHLIDGVPFGRPYLKRSLSSRPPINIPPRKRRRTTFSSWDMSLYREEEDTDWTAPRDEGVGMERSLLAEDAVDSDQGTVIKHDKNSVDDFQASGSDADTSDLEGEDLTQELKGLEEDLNDPRALEAIDIGSTPWISEHPTQMNENCYVVYNEEGA
jgi:hypothetical protein